MILEGKAHVFGDNINTDWIISGRYKFKITDMKELAKYLFEDIRPNFYDEIDHGNAILIAGENFGMGSSREQAPWAIKEAGINCVIAKNFARIFYRNAFNIGLPLVEADTSGLTEGDHVSVNLDTGFLTTRDSAREIRFTPWNDFQKELIQTGGIINYLNTHGDLSLTR
ncbi:MAG: 3-isopropylmalate dehydratase [Candidatus Omnitrophica bacterium]|nr:3-isopropylmalate dehydratase [Candidatus Omnitrophota bacterium]